MTKREENSSLCRPHGGNKTTAVCRQGDGDVAIFAAPSTPHEGEATFLACATPFNGTRLSGRSGILRHATSRSPAPGSMSGPKNRRRPTIRCCSSTMCWRARTPQASPRKRGKTWAGSRPSRCLARSTASGRRASSIPRSGPLTPSDSRRHLDSPRPDDQASLS